nr:MAG TPA: hypothetical protein [Caudoviricetes sp.]
MICILYVFLGHYIQLRMNIAKLCSIYRVFTKRTICPFRYFCLTL